MIENNSFAEVLPLFSSVVGKLIISEDLSKLQKIKKNYKFQMTGSTTSDGEASNSQISVRNNILDDFPEEKLIVEKYFNYFKNFVLKLDYTDFIMTTSWATKLTKNSFCHFHMHQNSMYSAVLYLDDDEKAAEIEFDSCNIFTEQISANPPTEFNLFNSKRWSICPQKNMMLIFPSYLMHRIKKHNSDKPRYSIAFNFFPKVNIGSLDSSLDISKLL